jgi:uncharacterized membrane protein
VERDLPHEDDTTPEEHEMPNPIATAIAVAAGYLVYKKLGKTRFSSRGALSTTKEVVDVNVPLRTAYNQWTQFEEFPRFMDNVLEVRQLDNRHLHWRASIAGREEQWDAEITEQIPDQRIAWRSISGARNEGEVTFRRLSDSSTRIVLRMTYEPRTADEKLGDTLGLVRSSARASLERFKSFVEGRGVETGAWRGTVGSTGSADTSSV